MLNRTLIVNAAVERLTQRVFEPPRLDPERLVERVQAITEAIQQAIPGHATSEQIQHACDRAIRDLSLGAKSSAWPLPRDVLEAVRRHAPETRNETRKASSARIAAAVEWWHKHGDVPDWWNDEATVRGMVEAGVDPVSLRRAWANVPRDLLPENFGRVQSAG